MTQYPSFSKKMTIAAGATVKFTPGPAAQPFEALTMVVVASAAGNYDATPTLNDQAITAKAVAAVTSIIPQVIQIDGIFPAQKKNTDAPGIQPGLNVKNNGAAGLTVQVYITARSYGPGV